MLDVSSDEFASLLSVLIRELSVSETVGVPVHAEKQSASTSKMSMEYLFFMVPLRSDLWFNYSTQKQKMQV